MSKRWQRVLSTLATRVAAQNHTKGKSRPSNDTRTFRSAFHQEGRSRKTLIECHPWI